MSEKIFRLLLQLYPPRFRHEYGDEALQLFHDRARDETGAWSALRLWLDLLADLVTSLARGYRPLHPKPANASLNARLKGAPAFFVFDTASPGRRPLLLGGLLSLIIIASLPRLMNEFGNRRPPQGWSFAARRSHENQSGEPQRPASASGPGTTGTRRMLNHT
jgi:hypothetical protein